MEDGDAVRFVHHPSPPVEEGLDSPDPDSDGDDEWDAESMFSDASTEILVEEDEDDVVPCSFSLSAPTNPSPPELGEQLPELSTSSEEELSPPSADVYGSNSEHLGSVTPVIPI